MMRTPIIRTGIRQYRLVIACFSVFLLLFTLSSSAQLPYQESFKNSTAPNTVFGPANTPAFLTAGPTPANISINRPAGPALDPNGGGFLQLTNNSVNQKGYIYNTQSFPSKKGFHIEVEYFVYQGTGKADGICFFLFDASAGTSSDPFIIGGFGGSLGYAPKSENGVDVRGLSKGYIGVGLDEYGNYSNPTEGRAGGIGFRPGSVGLRGKGDAGIPTSQYPYIASVQTASAFGFALAPADNRDTVLSDPNYRRVIVDMEPQVTGGNVTGYRVRVNIVRGSATPLSTEVLNQLYSEPPPNLLKYGISASTGDATNFHEIRNVRIDKSNYVTLSAVNGAADALTKCLRSVSSFNVTANDVSLNDGAVIRPETIDLDPSTPLVLDKTFTNAKGTFTAANDGTVTFTPANNTITGSATVSYTVQDNYSVVSNSTNFTITDDPAPTVSAGPNQGANVTAVASPNNSATLTATTSAGSGTWSQVSGATTAVFSSPNSLTTNVSGLSYGVYTFRFTAATATSCAGTGDTNVDINAIPVTVNDQVSTSTSTDILIPILDNDTDANGNNTINKTTVTLVTLPVNGVATIDPVSGKVNYRPNTGFSGGDSFTYTVKDDHNAVSQFATVSISVSLKPVGTDDNVATFSNIPVPLNVKTNDQTQTGTTVVKTSDPVHGLLTLGTQGAGTYNPATDYHGFDVFTYVLRNQFNLDSDPITVNITVRPAGTDDLASTKTNVPVNIAVKDNDSGKTGSNVVKKTDPQHGTIVIQGNGTVTYSPAVDYHGPDTFTYSLLDAAALESAPITVSINVRPAGTDDAVTTNINTPVIVPVKDNDVSKVGTTVIKTVDPASGTALVNNDGTVTYTPTTGFTGDDTFKYILRNSNSLDSDPITVTVTVRPRLATVPDTALTSINTPVNIAVKTNDPGSAPYTVIKQSDPGHGTATVNANGTILYTPVTDYYGPDSFTYILRNSTNLESNPTLVTIGVRPAGTSDTYATALNTAFISPVKDNDVSKIGTVVIKLTEPLHGTAIVNNDNTITYTPAANYSGTDVLTYLLRTADPYSSDAISVTYNIRPAGTNDIASTLINTPVTIPVKTNDVSGPGNSVVKKSEPVNGSATVNPDGTITYIPTTGYNGPDSFTYALRTPDGVESTPITATVSVRPAGTDDVTATNINTPVTVPVKDNDAGRTGTTVVKTVNPPNGTALVNPDNTITYTPANGFTGDDTFKYILRVGSIDSDPVTVTVSVRPKLQTVADNALTNINTPINIPVKANDPASNAYAVIRQSDPAHGTATVNADGSILYTPAANYYGPDSFNYILRSSGNLESDPTLVTIGVRPAGSNDVYATALNTGIIVSVKDNDVSKIGTAVIKLTDPAHGTAVLNNDNTFTYTPASNYNGADVFTYLLRTADPLSSDPVTVTISIRPSGSSDIATTPMNTPVVIAVKNNDVSGPGNGVLKKTDPLNGTLTDNGDGTFTYNPVPGYLGPDAFTYALRTPDGVESDPIPVSLSIRPSGTDDIAATNIGVAVVIPVLSNDAGRTGTTVIKTVNPVNGTAVVNPDNTVTYTPASGFQGTDSFKYILRTSTNVDSDPITVTITIRPKLATIPDNALTNLNTPVNIAVRDNDPGSSGFTVISQSAPAHGSATVNPDGSVVYVPATNYYGPDSFTYILRSSTNQESDPTLVVIGVRPGGTNDTYSTLPNVPVISSVKDNDVSKVGTTVIKQSDPAHGTAIVNVDGTITYTPALNYTGMDVLTYILRTGDPLNSDAITVSYTIRPSGSSDLASTLMSTPVIIPVKNNDVSGGGNSVAKKSDPGHGTASPNADGTVTYTPATGFHGKDTFTYVLRTPDGSESDPITVQVNIRPTGTNDATATDVGVPVIVKIKDNDAGKTGTSVVKKTDPIHGTVVLNADGTVTYTPVASYKGPDTFTYTLLNADGLESDPITVSVEVRTPPVANNDVIATVTGQAIKVNLMTNDTGENPLNRTSVTILTPPLHGTVSVDAVTGEILYTPAPGYSGPDSFTYSIKDDKGLESKPALVTIGVTAPKVGLAKKLVELKTALNGSYDIKYLFTIVNYSSFGLSYVSLKDDLLSVFSGTTVKVVKLSHQGPLTVNPNFNGTTDIEMLKPANSTIIANGEEQVELTINVTLNSRQGLFQNSAIVEGTIPGGGKVTDQSTDGLKPDPNTPGDVTPAFATPVDLKLNPLFIPEGFSPNGDGINDYYVIQNTLGKPVLLEVYNRWNNLVYKSSDYQNDWDGKTTQGIHIGDYVPSGTYYYILVLDNTQKFNGFMTINR